MLSKLINFITTDIWRIPLKKTSRKKSFFIKQARIILLALRGFNEDKCLLWASALTFYTLLSIVPIAAMAFGVAKGFGFAKILENQLLQNFPGQGEVLTQVITFANTLLDNTKGGLIAGIGIALLFWTVIKVLGSIERSFDDIWGIKKTRTLARKFSDYLSVMLICPVLIILSSSITVFITTQVRLITESVAILGYVAPLIFFVLKLLPYCLIWVLFTFIYIFMPNTKVNFKSGLLGGIIAGTIYVIVQFLYIDLQVGVARYNAIYGSFAALPLFLVWLQVSWLIVLFGTEISFAQQNVDTYEFEPDCLKVSHSFKRLLSLRVAHLLVKNFTESKNPLNATEISHTLEIPIRLLRQILFELGESKLVSETCNNDIQETGYQPARDINKMSIKEVVDRMEHRGIDNIPVADTKELQTLAQSMKNFGSTIEKSQDNKLLKDI